MRQRERERERKETESETEREKREGYRERNAGEKGAGRIKK